MLKIYKIPVQTPFAVGKVNSFLVKDKPFTLIDPGPETKIAKHQLVEGLASLGVDVTDIARVILTHCHPDHSGLARWLNEIAGAEIYVHQYELYKLTLEHDFYQERLPFFQEAGLPTKALKEMLDDLDPSEKPVYLPDRGVTALFGGEIFEFEGGTLIALHLPGHSNGHIGLYEQDGQRLIAGDFILKYITPNPHMEPDPDNFAKRLPTLKQYLAGLDVLKKLDLRVILTGHGENINNCLEAIKKAEEHHEERLEVAASFLEHDWINVYQLTKLCYPHIKGFEVYLGISEIFAHVDYLLSEGRIVKNNSLGISYFKSMQTAKTG